MEFIFYQIIMPIIILLIFIFVLIMQGLRQKVIKPSFNLFKKKRKVIAECD